MGGNLVETLIGAVVLAVAGVFLFFAYSKADLGQVDGYVLTARFEKIDGITVGSDVTMSGIKIGTVVGQELDPQSYLAVVRMSIRNDVKLPLDSSVKVASAGLLGDQYLAIAPGADVDMLAQGDEIEYTQGAVDLTELIGKAIYSSGSGGGGGQKPAGDGG
jgi:phospholipid/cholesterol/gamma-HCH transport system substrate-binding protein